MRQLALHAPPSIVSRRQALTAHDYPLPDVAYPIVADELVTTPRALKVALPGIDFGDMAVALLITPEHLAAADFGDVIAIGDAD